MIYLTLAYKMAEPIYLMAKMATLYQSCPPIPILSLSLSLSLKVSSFLLPFWPLCINLKFFVTVVVVVAVVAVVAAARCTLFGHSVLGLIKSPT